MLLFLATVVEQLDLALEHILKGDVHNARFGLMLTDNAVELVLHQIAKDQAAKLKAFSYLRKDFPHSAALEKALGRTFHAKIKFSKLQGKLNDEAAQTITIMHGFRNEVYHVGLQHEAILAALSVFYFDTACGFLGAYSPNYFSWVSTQRLPERSKKYFSGHPSFPGEPDDFAKGCAALAKACAHDAAVTIAVLADHLDEVIADQNTCIDIIAGGIYQSQKRTRDKAVIECQAWPLAFTEEGKSWAQANGWTGGNKLQLVDWLVEHYPFKFPGDPMVSWRKRAERLRSDTNPHVAIGRYHSFMAETASLREALNENAQQVEAEIDAAVDRMRGK